MKKIRVDRVIEEDVDRVLLGGRDLTTNERVTFHVRPSPHYDGLLKSVKAGRTTVVEVPL